MLNFTWLRSCKWPNLGETQTHSSLQFMTHSLRWTHPGLHMYLHYTCQIKCYCSLFVLKQFVFINLTQISALLFAIFIPFFIAHFATAFVWQQWNPSLHFILISVFFFYNYGYDIPNVPLIYSWPLFDHCCFKNWDVYHVLPFSLTFHDMISALYDPALSNSAQDSIKLSA